MKAQGLRSTGFWPQVAPCAIGGPPLTKLSVNRVLWLEAGKQVLSVTEGTPEPVSYAEDIVGGRFEVVGSPLELDREDLGLVDERVHEVGVRSAHPLEVVERRYVTAEGLRVYNLEFRHAVLGQLSEFYLQPISDEEAAELLRADAAAPPAP